MNVWRDRLERWFSPMARRCPLSPNAISLVALGLNLLAATCLFRAASHAWLFLAAVVLLVVGGLADAFDGVVARVQNKTSRFGDFLDHFADRVSDLALAASWMLGNQVRPELAVAAIIAISLNGYIGTQVEATYGKREYDTVGRGEFVLALVVFPIVSFILFSNGWDSLRTGGLTVPEWMSVVLAVFALLGVHQRFGVAVKLERQ